MSRQLLSRADQLYNGRVTANFYQGDKPGFEMHTFNRFRPTGNRAATFTGGIAAGATTATLTGNWAGASGLYPITFSDGSQLRALMKNGNTAVTFYPASAPASPGTYGVPTGPVNAVTANATVGNQPPVLGVANAIALSQAINTGTPGLVNGALATAGVATLDVARNIVAAWTGAAIMTVTGTDMYGNPQTESSASGTAFTGKKAFKTVTAINVSANVTALTMGTGNVLGLPCRVSSGDIFAVTLADAADAGTFVVPDLTNPATATTGDPKGTYAPAGALDGVKFLAMLLKPADLTTVVGTFGVTPA
jgi:hypothetical protein